MFDNINTYVLRTEISDGIIHYFTSFRDGQYILQEEEITHEVYLALDECRKHEKRQKNYHDRYIEHSSLTDEALLQRAFTAPLSIEETIERKEMVRVIQAAVEGLPEVQRRRFLLYYVSSLTYDQIAEREGCTKMPVKRSIDHAVEKIHEAMKKLQD